MENFAPTCSVVLRRELIGTLPPWHCQLAMGDWSLLALVAEHGDIELMDEVMAVYRVHPGGIWASRPTASRLREISRMLEVLDKHFEFKYTHVIRPALAKRYFDLALLERERGSRFGHSEVHSSLHSKRRLAFPPTYPRRASRLYADGSLV